MSTNFQAYGTPNGLSGSNLAAAPVSSVRAPLGSDTQFQIGQTWVDTVTNLEYVFVGISAGAAVWNLSSQSTSALNTLTADSGGALNPTANNINILGSANEITTAGAVSTITLSIPAVFVAPGSIASTTTIASGTTLTAGTSLAVTTSATIGTTLAVTGATTLAAVSATNALLSGTLGVTGLSTLAALTQVGTASINGSGAATTTIGSATAGAITVDSSAGISLDAATASNFTVTGAGADLTLNSAGGSVLVRSTEDAALAIRLHANGGTSETIQIHSDQGTGVGSINLLSDVGGITLTATGLASADAINLEATAGGVDVDAALQINIASSQNAADAIRIVASAGGIDVDAVGAAGEDIVITNTGGSISLVATENVTDAIVIQASGAAGGIDLIAGTNHVSVTGNLNFVTAGNKILSANVGAAAAAGANSFGSVTLVGGTVTVATTAVTASSLIYLTRGSIGATGAAALGHLAVGTIVAGTSFVINALQAADATALQASDVSVINWFIVN